MTLHMRCMRHEQGDKSLSKFAATSICTRLSNMQRNRSIRRSLLHLFILWSKLNCIHVSSMHDCLAGVVRSTSDCHGRMYDISQNTKPCLASALAAVHDVVAFG